jgi:predicted Zn-dependent peptidase
MHTTPSGLTTVFLQRPGPTGAIGVFVTGGSAQEPKPGLAHLTEHLVFRGSRTRTGAQILADDTRMGGHGNAYTSEDEVAYTTRVVTADLPQALAHLLDFVVAPSCPEDVFDAERRIIHEEITMREDQPQWQAWQALNAAVWGGHPYGRSIAGTHADLDALTLDDVRAYHATHYTPERLQIIQVGGTQYPEFPHIWPTAQCAARTPCLPPMAGSQTTITVPGDQAHVYVGLRLPVPSHVDFPALVRLTDILGGTGSARLPMDIRETRGLAYSVGTAMDIRKEGTLWCAYAGCHPANVEVVVDAIQTALARATDSLVTADELRDTHTYRTITDTFAEETPSGVVRKLRFDLLHHGTPQPPLPACDAETLRTAAQTWLTGPMAVVVALPAD